MKSGLHGNNSLDLALYNNCAVELIFVYSFYKAEILGAVSSVAGLLGTAITLVQEVQKARNRINGSSKTLEDITKELANVYSTLILVKEESKLQTSSVIQQVETIIGVGNELKAFFDIILLEQQRKQIKQFFRAIKSGDDNDKELAALLGRLDRAKAELGLRISLAQISLIGNLHDGYNVSLRVLQDLNDSVKKIAGPYSQIAGQLEAKQSVTSGGSHLYSSYNMKFVSEVDLLISFLIH